MNSAKGAEEQDQLHEMNHTEEHHHYFYSYSTIYEISNPEKPHRFTICALSQIPQKVIVLSPSGCEGGSHEEKRAATLRVQMR